MSAPSYSPRLQLDDSCAVSKLIEIVRPDLHHLDPFGPKFRSVHVGSSNVILFLVCELPFDGVFIPLTHFVEKG